MSLERNIRLTYDESSGLVGLRVVRRRGHGTNRHRRHVALELIPRRDLRTLCDLLHDYADRLDHEHPNRPTGDPRGKGVAALTTSSPGGSTGSETSLPGGGTPSRARAREEVTDGAA